MEDNINLDDEEEFTKKDILNSEEKQKFIKKILIKFINRAHDKPLLLRKAMTFKDWKNKACIKQDELNKLEPKMKKIKKKIKKKKTIKKVKNGGDIDLEN
ncbi:MAG: hypothetical protein VZR95_10390, partial [Alphaproteobacteria bacterium]